jgi:large subunit ribosomal protein L22
MPQASATKIQPQTLVRASARYLHLSPRKMRLVTNLVKGMQVSNAMAQLQHTNKKAAGMVAKLLKSAVANAENNFSLQSDHLYIKSITADMGVVMKRYFPRARGSAFPIRRKTCHVNVVLEERKAGKIPKVKSTALLKRKTEEVPVVSADQKEATNEKPAKIIGRKSEVTKTEQQVKLNQQQNKRRLFNRKSGE